MRDITPLNVCPECYHSTVTRVGSAHVKNVDEFGHECVRVPGLVRFFVCETCGYSFVTDGNDVVINDDYCGVLSGLSSSVSL